MANMAGCIWVSQVIKAEGRNVRELPHAERTHMEADVTCVGKTTVIVRKANLLNLSKPKEKGGRGRGGEEEKKEVKERGDQGMESRGGKRESQSVESGPPGLQLYTHGEGHFHSNTQGQPHSLLFMSFLPFYMCVFCSSFVQYYCSIYSPVAHDLKWPPTLNPRPLYSI